MGASCSTGRGARKQLQKLLDELLLMLIQYLDRASLVRLCRVSRPLREVGSSALYRRTQVGRGTWEMPAATFNRSPRLAQYVRDLIIHYHRTGPGEVPYAEALTPVLTDMHNSSSLTVKGAACDGCPPHKNKPGRKTKFPITESDKARQVLESAKFYHFFLKSTFLPVLTNLRVCKLRFSDKAWWDLSARDSIFLHPHLKQLFIYGAAMKDFCCYSEKRRSSTSLEELYLSECDMSPATLHEILALPKALRHFTLTGGIFQDQYQATGERQSYLNAVEQHAHSLKTLKLELPWAASYDTPNAALKFKAFTILEELTTTTELLTGNLGDVEPPPPPSDPFPGSLKTIRLRYAMAFWETEWEQPWESAIADWVNTGALGCLSKVFFYRRFDTTFHTTDDSEKTFIHTIDLETRLQGTKTANVTLFRYRSDMGHVFPIHCWNCNRKCPLEKYSDLRS
ncbi:hypothetical protein BDV19DRAFT_389486 [Aspergillus venezuelensis]